MAYNFESLPGMQVLLNGGVNRNVALTLAHRELLYTHNSFQPPKSPILGDFE
jgi:hypothetical protein